MEVFISWSGDRSKTIAQKLKKWIRMVLHSINPWVSAEDINAGERWQIELAKALEKSSVGIVCITPENVSSQWVLFECGALSKAFEKSILIPILYDLDLHEMSGPLSQFQAKKFDKESMLDVIQLLNSRTESPLEEGIIKEIYEAMWPNLEKSMRDVPRSKEPAKKRSQAEILEDIVSSVKGLDRRFFEMSNNIRAVFSEQEELDRECLTFEILGEMITEIRALITNSQDKKTVLCGKFVADFVEEKIKNTFTVKVLSKTASQLAKDVVAEAREVKALLSENKS